MVVGRYRVERMLARGGMSSVYVARQVHLNRAVALKILSPALRSEEDAESFEARFQLEARTLASLQHPNIVVVHDYGETAQGEYFLAMELIDGPRFSDLLRDGAMAPERAIHLVLGVCHALRYAHRRGVIHRDIKLSNVLIRQVDGEPEQARVVDFGLVKLTEQDSELTAVGTVMGSPHFMSPEQARGFNVDARSDIYSTGVLLFCALTARYPFHGPNNTATLSAVLTQDTPTFSDIAPSLTLPGSLELIVRRCLSKDPARRYSDMQGLIDDLEAVQASLRGGPPARIAMVGEPLAPSPESTLFQPGSRSARRAAVFAAFAVGALVALGVGAFAFQEIHSVLGSGAAAGTAEAAPAEAVAEPDAPAGGAPAEASETQTPADVSDAAAAPQVTPAASSASRRSDELASSAAPADAEEVGSSSAATAPSEEGAEEPGASTKQGSRRGSDLRNPWGD